MAKDPTPRADELRIMRERRYGHLQATACDEKLIVAQLIAASEPMARPPKPPRKRIKRKRKT